MKDKVWTTFWSTLNRSLFLFSLPRLVCTNVCSCFEPNIPGKDSTVSKNQLLNMNEWMSEQHCEGPVCYIVILDVIAFYFGPKWVDLIDIAHHMQQIYTRFITVNPSSPRFCGSGSLDGSHKLETLCDLVPHRGLDPNSQSQRSESIPESHQAFWWWHQRWKRVWCLLWKSGLAPAFLFSDTTLIW